MFNNDVQNKFQYFAYIKKSCIYLVMISAVIQYIHAPMGLCPKNVYKPMTNRGSIYQYSCTIWACLSLLETKIKGIKGVKDVKEIVQKTNN